MARGRKSAWRLALSPQDRDTLPHGPRSTTIAAGLVRRGSIILLLAAGHSPSDVAQVVGVQRPVVRQWATRFLAQGLEGLADAPGRGAKGFSPPEVAIHVVRLACARPDMLGRSRSPWDGQERARQRIAAGIVEDISAATVRRMLRSHQLKPWRGHGWLHPKPPRDAAFSATVSARIDRYTRPLPGGAIVLAVDEQTSLQPRPRQHPTLPAQPQHLPNRCAHEDTRAGALQLFAAFDTRSGKVYGPCWDRTRQPECIAFLAQLDRGIAAHVTRIHRVCDHVSTHHGQEVRRWLSKPPRVVFHFTPVHGSWMNHVEQWCSILPRNRFRSVDFESTDHLRATIGQFIAAWNQDAHPFNWSTESVAKVMAEAPALAA